jgi:hypothetical protein
MRKGYSLFEKKSDKLLAIFTFIFPYNYSHLDVQVLIDLVLYENLKILRVFWDESKKKKYLNVIKM